MPPKPDETPKMFGTSLEAGVDALLENAKAIARLRKGYYEAYVAEGFSRQEAFELCKEIGG